jgi:hypothetical protein
MPVSQFDEPVQLPHADLGVVAKGTWIGLGRNEVVESMRVWVYQPTGAACHGECEFPMGHGPADLPWRVPTAKEPGSADFREGPGNALAIAVLVDHDNPAGSPKVVQWSQTITVTDLGQGDADAAYIRAEAQKEQVGAEAVGVA